MNVASSLETHMTSECDLMGRGRGSPPPPSPLPPSTPLSPSTRRIHYSPRLTPFLENGFPGDDEEPPVPRKVAEKQKKKPSRRGKGGGVVSFLKKNLKCGFNTAGRSGEPLAARGQ